MSTAKSITIEQIGSRIGCTERQRQTLTGLGLTRRGQVRTLNASESVLGMVRKVQHLVRIHDAAPAKK